MDFNYFNFEEFMKAAKESQEKANTTNNCNAESNNCNDIPGGFQDLNPQFFILMAEILGAVMAGKLPFNVQNVIGNWLELLAQVILTFNAQQQYFQSGPGRYYNVNFKNVDNSSCSNSSNTTQTSSNAGNSSATQEDLLKKTFKMYENEINNLKESIEDLKKQIEKLKCNNQK
ncbi:hypothetical protein [Clostridium weizhouense]|uniref:Uncharacterized protein n=1 Tax=Clostridium weizhouense TaxID=2859781 RepID=A0ABS7AKP4_9CLOT|nr:hypothetical protein [Clostridium weizhouense]MBW6409239.1 hypothetical protein [Clostridium weizhouense]